MRFNKLLLLCTAFVLSLNMQAQDLKILVNKKGKIGYADQNGNEIIKCQYESGMPFSNGIAIVTKSGKSGIIDTRGTVLLPLKYTQIVKWNDELFLIKNGKKMGLADRTGKIVLPVNYSHISKANSYGKALIALGGKSTANEKKTYMANAKYGIIDMKGTVLVEPKYKGLYEFCYDGKGKYPFYEGKRLEYSYHNTTDTLVTDCAYLGFSNNGFSIYNAGIMDGNGRELLKAGLYYFVMQPQSNMVRYYISKKKETLCGYHNLETGKGFQVAKFNSAIGDINYWSHGDYIGNIAPVNGSSWSFVDKAGQQLRTGFTELKHSQTTGLWAAKNSSGTWDVFDDSNTDVTALSGYADINFPVYDGDKEVFSVMKDGKGGCVSRSGEIVVPLEYEQVSGNHHDFIAVKKDGEWGAVTPANVEIIPVKYADVMFPSEKNVKHFWVQKSDSLYYHFNASTQKVSTTGYKVAQNFHENIALVVPVGMVVDDTQVNRAQVYEPNTKKETLDALKLSEYTGAFGYLLGTDDVLLVSMPVSTMYKDKVVAEIIKRGGRALTETENKNILLDITRENRSYDLKSTLSEDEWNY